MTACLDECKSDCRFRLANEFYLPGGLPAFV